MSKVESLMNVSIIVSSEEGVDFYKSLGFSESRRVCREQCHDEVILLSNDFMSLEVYKDATHPKHCTAPEQCGLRHLCFYVDRIDGDCKEDDFGKYKYIYDPDNQPIKIRERKQ